MSSKPLAKGDLLKCGPLFPLVQGSEVYGKVTRAKGSSLSVMLTVRGIRLGVLEIEKTDKGIVRTLSE